MCKPSCGTFVINATIISWTGRRGEWSHLLPVTWLCGACCVCTCGGAIQSFMDELYVYAMERSPSHLVWRGGGTVTPLPTVLNVTRIFVEFEGIKGVAYYPGFRLIFSFHKVSKLAYLMSSGHFSFSPLFQLYKGTAQLSSLTEFKFHFISALLVGETIQPMKERRKPE